MANNNKLGSDDFVVLGDLLDREEQKAAAQAEQDRAARNPGSAPKSASARTPGRGASTSEQRTAALMDALRQDSTPKHAAAPAESHAGERTGSAPAQSPLPKGIPISKTNTSAAAPERAQRRSASGRRPAAAGSAAADQQEAKAAKKQKKALARQQKRTAGAKKNASAAKESGKVSAFSSWRDRHSAETRRNKQAASRPQPAGTSRTRSAELQARGEMPAARRAQGTARQAGAVRSGGTPVRQPVPGTGRRTASQQRRMQPQGQITFKKARPTKNMTVGEKARYYVGQIGPTMQAVRTDPRRRESAYRLAILLIALILAIYVTSCVNDIMGFNRSDKEIAVTVSADANTNDLIKTFRKAKLIKHSVACRTFINLTSGIRGDEEAPSYLKGEYFLTPSMGVEKMLMTCRAIQKKETVQVTFPEGYSIEQMAEKLEDAKVCTSSDFLKACNKASYEFDFIDEISNPKQRYHILEGYMYPDTYEFFVGENAESCVTKVLSNFNKKWSDDYAERAAELNMSVDDVMTMASIIQKEDSNPENMAIIASVFYNRLNSTSYPSLQSDATNNYVNKYIKPNVSADEYKLYRSRYSTYVCVGLPVGPICSPGDDAIKAVLWPESTNYYFFAHDSDGTLHAAVTETEQNINVFNSN